MKNIAFMFLLLWMSHLQGMDRIRAFFYHSTPKLSNVTTLSSPESANAFPMSKAPIPYSVVSDSVVPENRPTQKIVCSPDVNFSKILKGYKHKTSIKYKRLIGLSRKLFQSDRINLTEANIKKCIEILIGINDRNPKNIINLFGRLPLKQMEADFFCNFVLNLESLSIYDRENDLYDEWGEAFLPRDHYYRKKKTANRAAEKNTKGKRK